MYQSKEIDDTEVKKRRRRQLERQRKRDEKEDDPPPPDSFERRLARLEVLVGKIEQAVRAALAKGMFLIK